jgi:4,5-dihydroxyphthalate decarboxylase
MSNIQMSLACNLNDRTRALADGSIEPAGIDLTFLPFDVEETFWRMLKHQEFDAAEMSMSSYMMARDRGSPELVGIPVFLSRCFRHSCVFVNTDAGIDEPADLAGKSVGVPEYQITASMMVRGLLQHQYGVYPSDMVWYQGGEEEVDREEKLDIDLPDSIDISPLPEGRTLSGMLCDCDLDALISARIPSSFETDSVERLFTDFRRVEREYYRETGIFPIMHCVVFRREVYDENPWIAREFCKAFKKAKNECLNRLSDTSELPTMLPWLQAELDSTRKLMGWDFWPYGVEENRHVLETMIQYSNEQGLTKQRLDLDELFAPNTYDKFAI